MDSEKGNEFLREIVRIIFDEQKIVGNTEFIKENHKKLLEFKYPEELEVSLKYFLHKFLINFLMDLKRALDLEVGEEGATNSKLLDICQHIIEYSVKTCNDIN